MTTKTTTHKITALAQSTEDDLMAPVHSLRTNLINGATEGWSAKDLHEVVEAIAVQEAVARVRYNVSLMAAAGRTAQEIREALTDTLLVGADDRWSGRGNDLKRAAFDGVREEVRDLMYALRTWTPGA